MYIGEESHNIAFYFRYKSTENSYELKKKNVLLIIY